MPIPIIAIDAMGKDFGPRCVIPTSIVFLAENSYSRLALVNQPVLLEELLSRYLSLDRRRLRVYATSEVIGSDEYSSQTLHDKPDASMRVALELVRDDRTHVCVSAGNIGMLMALSRHPLKALPGVDRPAMITAVPAEKRHCHLLDFGADVDCSAEHLYQLTVMGVVVAGALGYVSPWVVLFNVGTKEIKDNQQVKLVTNLLQKAQGLNFSGYIEGDSLYRGEANVVVCDGFVGNILLRVSEGLVTMVSTRIEQRLHGGLATKPVGALVLPLLCRLCGDTAPTRCSDTSFLGSQGIVVKGHGSATEGDFQSVLCRAAPEVRENLPQRLHGRLEYLLL